MNIGHRSVLYHFRMIIMDNLPRNPQKDPYKRKAGKIDNY